MPRHSNRTQYKTIPQIETGFRCTLKARHEELEQQGKTARKRDWMSDPSNLQVVCSEEHKFTPSGELKEEARSHVREFVEWMQVDSFNCETCVGIWKQELKYQKAKEEKRVVKMAATNCYEILALA